MPGSIIVIAKLKGGSGATTTCRELAAAALADGKKVAVIDLDGQGSLGRWWNRRTRSPVKGRADPDLLEIPADQIAANAAKLRAGYDITLVDSPPTVHATIRAVAASADLALVPSRPTIDDLDATGPVVRLLHGAVDLAFVLTQVPGGARSRDGAEAVELLASRAPVLGRTSSRLDYSRPPATGSTGYESSDVARQEIGALYARVLERLSLNQDAIASAPEAKRTAKRKPAVTR